MRLLKRAYKVTIESFILVILAVLLVLSMLTTVFNEFSEHVVFIKDFSIKHIVILLTILAAVYFLSLNKNVNSLIRRINENDKTYKIIRGVLLTFIFVVSSIWVCTTRFTVYSDSLVVRNTACELNERIYNAFSYDGYIARYPNNHGLLVFFYIWGKIFGFENYISFSLLNALLLTIFCYQITEIMSFFKQANWIRLLTCVIYLFYFPIIVYCSFQYGTLIGLSLSISAIRYAFEFFRSNRYRHCTLSILLMFMALLMKQNYLVFMLGILIYSLVRFNKKTLVLASLMILFYVIASNAPTLYLRYLTKQELNTPASTLGWIAMGFQEEGEGYTTLGPGWYNGYISHSLREVNYDTDAHSQFCKSDLKEEIANWISHPKAFASFMIRKAASQWCAPSFQAFWIVDKADSEIEGGNWFEQSATPMKIYCLDWYLNIFQTCIYFGSLAFVILNKRENYLEVLVPLMIVIGGFVFHQIWEAKSQYTISYFVLLFPYAVEGFALLVTLIKRLVEEKSIRKPASIVTTKLVITMIVLVLMTIALSGNRSRIINKDTDYYNEYLVSYDVDNYIS